MLKDVILCCEEKEKPWQQVFSSQKTVNTDYRIVGAFDKGGLIEVSDGAQTMQSVEILKIALCEAVRSNI